MAIRPFQPRQNTQATGGRCWMLSLEINREMYFTILTNFHAFHTTVVLFQLFFSMLFSSFPQVRHKYKCTMGHKYSMGYKYTMFIKIYIQL